MKLSPVHFVLIVPSVFLLGHLNVIAGTVLSKPDIVYTDDTCGENEVYSLCLANSACERNCDNIDVWDSMPCVQTKNCRSGCICKEGYVRDKQRNACIWENSCPRVRH